MLHQLRILLFFLLLPLYLMAQHVDPDKPEQVSILFIGNSFLANNNMPDLVKDIASAAGFTCYIDHEIKLGKCINDHVNDKHCWQLLYYYNWDYVVIQDNQQYYYNSPPSIDSFSAADGKVHATNLLENNIRLQDSVKKIAPCAKIIWFEGWEKEGGFPKRFPDDNTEKMIGRIHENYKYLNNRPGVHNLIAPIGDAFVMAFHNRAYYEKVSKEEKDFLYDFDGRHPGYGGSYLGACVLYTMIFHQSPVGIKPTYTFVNTDNDTFIKRIAWQTVMKEFKYTNLASAAPKVKHGIFNRHDLFTAQKYASYQWYSGSTKIQGATGRHFKPGQDLKKSYWVETRDEKGCRYWSFPYALKN